MDSDYGYFVDSNGWKDINTVPLVDSDNDRLLKFFGFDQKSED